MNINTGLNPYNSSFINNVADLSKMSQSQSLTGSPTDTLKEGEVFEGSVNSIENGKVTIGLANGQTMTARIDSGVNLTPGQSVFFQVKSNDGSLIQLKPVSLNSLETNPTLLKALDMANIAASERTINMVNAMMQNSMSINPDNLSLMNRTMLNNPQVDVQTLVTMAKHGLEINPDNVAMFQNYASDKAVLTDNFETISSLLPDLMTSEEVSVSEVINLNSKLAEIFIQSGEENENVSVIQQLQDGAIIDKNVVAEADLQGNTQEAALEAKIPTNVTEEILDVGVKNQGLNLEADEQISLTKEAIANLSTNDTQVVAEAKEQPVVLNEAEVATENNAPQAQSEKAIVAENESGTQVLNSFAGEKQITSFNTILSSLPDFPKDNLEIFGENGTLRADANIKEVFREITEYLEKHPDIPKETLNDIIKAPLYKGLLKNLIADSFAMEPKNVTKPGELSKLYERVLKQTDALEKLISNFNNKAAEGIKNQTSEIKQNINFMNSANEMYHFVQIPLKMYNQNTDSMLYVRQNKKSSYEAGEEITAFLHFDMEYLGPTDVFISLREMKVGCKWNLADESSLKIIEDNIDILTERLNAKGFTVSTQMVCGEPKADFVEDFLGAPPLDTSSASEGLVHRYSFDMRA